MGDALLVNLLLPCPSITPFQARFSFSFLMPQSILSVACYIYVWLHAYGLPGLKFLFIIFWLSLYSSFLLNCCGLFLKILFTLFLIDQVSRTCWEKKCWVYRRRYGIWTSKCWTWKMILWMLGRFEILVVLSK